MTTDHAAEVIQMFASQREVAKVSLLKQILGNHDYYLYRKSQDARRVQASCCERRHGMFCAQPGARIVDKYFALEHERAA